MTDEATYRNLSNLARIVRFGLGVYLALSVLGVWASCIEVGQLGEVFEGRVFSGEEVGRAI